MTGFNSAFCSTRQRLRARRPIMTTHAVRLILAATVLLAVGCSTRKGSGRVKQAQSPLDTITDGDAQRLRDARFGEGSIPRAEGESFFRDILFPFNSAELTPEAQGDIEANAKKLSGSSFSVTLEGHTDERGTSEYNLALGQRRAQAVLTYLVSLGVPTSRLTTVSYGENIPLEPGPSEDAWAVNRRVHFALGANEATTTIGRRPGEPRKGLPSTEPGRRRSLPLEEGAIDIEP